MLGSLCYSGPSPLATFLYRHCNPIMAQDSHLSTIPSWCVYYVDDEEGPDMVGSSCYSGPSPPRHLYVSALPPNYGTRFQPIYHTIMDAYITWATKRDPTAMATAEKPKAACVSMCSNSRTAQGKTVIHVIRDGELETQRSGRGGGNAARQNKDNNSGIVEGRKSLPHVQMTAAEVAALLKVKVLAADMPEFMQVHALRCARRASHSLDKYSAKQIAHDIKKEFDKVYGPTWHCIVGTSFGSFVTHSAGCFLYFSMEKILIMVFKTRIAKVMVHR